MAAKAKTRKSEDFVPSAALIAKIIRQGNWMVRADDGKRVSYGSFRWNPPGEWTEAKDWNETPECGGGLHGQDARHGGMIQGNTFRFCETHGKHVAIGTDKVKVRRARILLNELPSGLTFSGDLSLRGCTSLASLPENLSVGGWLDLSGSSWAKKTLPKGWKIKGDILR